MLVLTQHGLFSKIAMFASLPVGVTESYKFKNYKFKKNDKINAKSHSIAISSRINTPLGESVYIML